ARPRRRRDDADLHAPVRRAAARRLLRGAPARVGRAPGLRLRVGRRALVVVLDACGVGALPDAADYGDAGTNTLGHLAQAAGGLELPTLQALGLGSVLPLEGVAP